MTTITMTCDRGIYTAASDDLSTVIARVGRWSLTRIRKLIAERVYGSDREYREYLRYNRAELCMILCDISEGCAVDSWKIGI